VSLSHLHASSCTRRATPHQHQSLVLGALLCRHRDWSAHSSGGSSRSSNLGRLPYQSQVTDALSCVTAPLHQAPDSQCPFCVTAPLHQVPHSALQAALYCDNSSLPGNALPVSQCHHARSLTHISPPVSLCHITSQIPDSSSLPT